MNMFECTLHDLLHTFQLPIRQFDCAEKFARVVWVTCYTSAAAGVGCSAHMTRNCTACCNSRAVPCRFVVLLTGASNLMQLLGSMHRERLLCQRTA
jgi:hypothetical protein